MEEATDLMEGESKCFPLEGDALLERIGLENLLSRVDCTKLKKTHTWINELTLISLTLNIFSELVKCVDSVLDFVHFT